MTDLSDDSKALLAREAHFDEATAAEVDAWRVRMLAAYAALPASLPLAGASKAAGGAAAPGSATASKLGVVALFAVVGGSALWFSLSPPSGAPKLNDGATSVSALPAVSAAAPATADANELTPQRAVESPTKALDSAFPPAKDTGDEALLVATADAQLRDGHPAVALELYQRHLQKYPTGALRRESSAGRLMALCALGRTNEARPEVERMVAEQPGDPYVERVLRVCGSH